MQGYLTTVDAGVDVVPDDKLVALPRAMLLDAGNRLQPRTVRSGGLWEAKAAWLGRSAVAALRGIPDTDRYAEEWAYDMEQLPAGWARFRWALSLRLRAPRQIRRAASVKARVPAPPLPPTD